MKCAAWEEKYDTCGCLLDVLPGLSRCASSSHPSAIESVEPTCEFKCHRDWVYLLCAGFAFYKKIIIKSILHTGKRNVIFLIRLNQNECIVCEKELDIKFY